MLKLFAGPKGQGKTKKLIDLANSTETEGYIIFIDSDRKNMHELNRDIRLVETSEFPLATYREFLSFVYGMLSQNGDIKDVFIDSISTLVKNIDMEDTLKLTNKLEEISQIHRVNFFFSIHANPDELPDELKKFI